MVMDEAKTLEDLKQTIKSELHRLKVEEDELRRKLDSRTLLARNIFEDSTKGVTTNNVVEGSLTDFADELENTLEEIDQERDK